MLNQPVKNILRPAAVAFGTFFSDKSAACSDSLSGSEHFSLAVHAKCGDLGFRSCDLKKAIVLQMRTNNPVTARSFDSPERGKHVDAMEIGFEPERSLLRYQRFQLLCDAELTDSEAYNQFVRFQPADLKLTYKEFLVLREEAATLTCDERAVLNVTAVLKPSQEMIVLHKAEGFEIPIDSEEMLTEMTRLASDKGLDIMPAIKPLTNQQRVLLKAAYPFHFHIRHVLFAEAGLKELNEAIGNVSHFQIAKWRWIIDLCGFDRDKHGLTQPLWERAQFVFLLIHRAIEGDISPSEIMPRYFNFLKKQTGLDSNIAFNTLSENAQLMVLLLVSFYEHPSKVQINSIMSAYKAFEKKYGKTASDSFIAFLNNPKANSPTYLPAILKTAKAQFLGLDYSDAQSEELAAGYTLSVLETVYASIKENPDMTISARNAAWYQNWNSQSWADEYLKGALCFTVSASGAIETDVVAPSLDAVFGRQVS